MTPYQMDVMLRARQAMANAIDYLDAMMYSTKNTSATRTGIDAALWRALSALALLYRLRTQQGQAGLPPR